MKTATMAAACVLSTSALAQTYWVSFDPARGTLPSAQCWELHRSGGLPAPALTEGSLNIGPSSYSGTTYYSREASIDFSRGTVMEAEILIIDSAYRANPCGAGQRAGMVLSLTDVASRHVTVGIGNGTVYMTTINNAVVGSPLAPRANVACQGVWRRFRLEVSGGVATLLIDGVPTLTVAVGATAGSSRTVAFGDASICAEGQARFGLVRFLAVEDCPVDFNRDGFVDFFDYDDFVRCFEGGDCPCDQTADFNGDEFPDFFDYDAFVSAFEHGC